MKTKLDSKITQHSNHDDAAINLVKLSDSEKIATLNSELKLLKKELKLLKIELKLLKIDMYLDTLTKVYNRKFILHNIIDAKNNFIAHGVIAMIDLNNLKSINDNLGHNIGDKFIQIVAKKLKTLPCDVVRFGGDEFLVFCKNNSEEEIFNMLKKIQNSFLDKVLESKGKKEPIGFAFAVDSYKSNDWFESTLEKVDKAMYLDKIKYKKKRI